MKNYFILFQSKLCTKQQGKMQLKRYQNKLMVAGFSQTWAMVFTNTFSNEKNMVVPFCMTFSLMV